MHGFWRAAKALFNREARERTEMDDLEAISKPPPQNGPPGQGPPGGEPPGQGPPDNGPPGGGPPPGRPPPGRPPPDRPPPHKPPNPGDGPPIADGNISQFPNAGQWPSVYGVPWDENWWQGDYEIDVVIGEGQPPEDHMEARHIGAARHASIHEQAAAMDLSLDAYWEVLAKAHAAIEAELEQERGLAHAQQRFLRPLSEHPAISYAGCFNCQGTSGCENVQKIIANARGKPALIHRQIHDMWDDQLNALTVDLHRYMTCVRSDIWAHERGQAMTKGTLEPVAKPYDTLADLPTAVKKLPKHAQEIYRAAFNAAYKQYDGDESKAHGTAWAAVKQKYRQNEDGTWVAKGMGEVLEQWFEFTEPEALVGKQWHVPIAKADDERRLVYGIVLEPGDAQTTDSQGDFVSEAEIELACHDFNRRLAQQRAAMGEQHERVASVDVVESYIAPADFDLEGEHVAKGSWVLVSFISDDAMWASVKSGELTGYSIGGLGERVAAA